MNNEAREGLAKLRVLAADEDIASTINAARIHDPSAVPIAEELSNQLFEHISKGGSASAVMTLCMAAIGYAHGGVVDTRVEGAGEATDLMAEVLVKTFKWSVDRGFAETRAELEGGNDER